MAKPDILSTFLHFGYLPEHSANQMDFLGDRQGWADRKKSLSLLQPSALVEEGARVLKRVFGSKMADGGSKCHVLPLSGGLDSRAILGGLLENLESNRIQAVTFGTPGTWDYEIGRQVARAFGVRCESLDLTAEGWKWDTAELVKTAARSERPVWVFDAYVNRQIPERFGAECVYWSGFLGEALTGAHLRYQDSESWGEAKSFFIQWNRFCRSIKLPPAIFVPENLLPASPWIDPMLLSYDAQLDLGIRQSCLIRHVVLPKEYNYQAPFLHPEWVEFMLNVPRCYREKQWLYKEILTTTYPRLFSLPTKTTAGLPLGAPLWQQVIRKGTMRARSVGKRILPRANWGVSPLINYIDFDRGLRERADLKAVVYENIQALKKRGCVNWIDIDDIWVRHQQKQGNYADALMSLASLEICIIAGKINL